MYESYVHYSPPLPLDFPLIFHWFFFSFDEFITILQLACHFWVGKLIFWLKFSIPSNMLWILGTDSSGLRPMITWTDQKKKIMSLFFLYIFLDDSYGIGLGWLKKKNCDFWMCRCGSDTWGKVVCVISHICSHCGVTGCKWQQTHHMQLSCWFESSDMTLYPQCGSFDKLFLGLEDVAFDQVSDLWRMKRFQSK